VPTNTQAKQIGLQWSAPAFDGGSAIQDYRVWFDNATNGALFSVFAEKVAALNYVATGLT